MTKLSVADHLVISSAKINQAMKIYEVNDKEKKREVNRWQITKSL